ncbi:hypothetical protein BS78_09G020400 [Paspalum vaginatum]|nr:hypothetical protein BS78_09G020400 [Paspalum vaginatum]
MATSTTAGVPAALLLLLLVLPTIVSRASAALRTPSPPQSAAPALATDDVEAPFVAGGMLVTTKASSSKAPGTGGTGGTSGGSPLLVASPVNRLTLPASRPSNRGNRYSPGWPPAA